MPQIRRNTVARGLLLTAVVLAGLAIRAAVLRSWMGELNSDEAYAGLQSLAVIRDGRFPVVIDGQVYTATLEAYLFAPLLVFVGGSIVALKGMFIGMWAVAALTAAGATRRLMGNRAAAATAAIMWLAPGALLVLSTRAYMGYNIGLAVVGATVWATAVAADLPVARWKSSALVGAGAGLAFYIHPMLLAAVVPVVAVAVVVHRRDWRRWWLPAAAAAVVVNLPFLAWNAANGWPSLNSQEYPPGSYWDRFSGFFTDLLPRAFGLRTFDGRWVFGGPASIAVFVLIGCWAVAGCVVLVRSGRGPSRLIVPITLAVCLPLMALFPHLIFTLDGRYSVIVFPFVAIAMGAAVGAALRATKPFTAMAAVACTAAVWVLLSSVPFLSKQHGFDDLDANAVQEQVIARLDQLGIDRVAGNFWLVMPLEFHSDRRIRVAIVGNPFVVRFPDSQRIVEQTPDDKVAYLFGPGTPPPAWLRRPLNTYHAENIGGMVLYVPIAAPG